MIDLHIHSNNSDGSDTVEEILKKSQQIGLNCISITDHDNCDVYDILKVNGLFLFTYQIGQGEDMADEPYLNEKGKNSLYKCYHTNEEINDLLHSFSCTELFKKQKIEISPSAINSNSVTTVFILAKKIK